MSLAAEQCGDMCPLVGKEFGDAEREASFRQALHASIFIERPRVGCLAAAKRVEIRVIIGEGLGDGERDADFRRTLHELFSIKRP